MRRTWWNAAILTGIVLFGALGAATRAAALEVITVRTGLSGGVPGACPDFDDRWTYNPVAMAPCSQPMRGAAFSATDFADAVAGPPARVVAPFGGFWISGLPSDPQARWIAHEKTGTCNGDVGSILYACSFTVTTPGATVGDVSVCWAVDDRLGDEPGEPNPVGVYVNGVPLSGSFSGGDFFGQSCATQTGVPLVTGTNFLYVYQRDLHCTTSGLMCTATITVATPPNPHILTVTTTDDADDGVCDATHCSLREAINAANAQAGSDSIRFAIPGTAPFHLQPAAALPVVSTTMAIDATSQAGFAGAPLVEMSGASAPTATDGLRVTAPDVSIAGLAIGQFHNGLALEGGGATVGLCYIGTDAAGATFRGNRENGIAVLSDSNRIGSAAAPNVISGNSLDGIFITGSANIVEGNRIGTNVGGTAQLHNGGDGIEIFNVTAACAGNRIGGGAAGAGNVISGNSQDGVRVRGGFVSGTIVQGNRIGTNAAGDGDVGNGTDGISVEVNAASTLIGGVAAGEGNVIAGMFGTGVLVNASSGTVIQGNRIGTNAAGTAAIANGTGIWVFGSSTATQIGGTDPAARNLISGCTLAGIDVESHASGTVIQGNWIGTDATGTAAIPNGTAGVSGSFAVAAGGPVTTIGGSAPGAGNVIAGNAVTGIELSAAQIEVLGNRIGVAANGQPLGNGLDGVFSTAFSTNARVGGLAAGEANEIAYNSRSGVRVFNPIPQGVRIEGNAIHDNAGLGIDLGPLGPAVNDPGDVDNGANAGMNFPVLSGATVGSAGLILTGTLATTPAMLCRICVYGNVACDPSGQGEGAVYLGAFDVTSNAAGNAILAATLPVTDLGTATTLSATATDSAGNTSEFSPCLVALPQPTAVEAPSTPRTFAVAAGAPASMPQVYLHAHNAGQTRVTLHDAAGRRLRILRDAPTAAGHHTLVWDGRDDRGEPVAAGVYFVRAELGAAVAVCRLSLTR